MEAESLPAASRALVRVVGLLVPPDRRADWRTEWTAELWVLHDRCRVGVTPATILALGWSAVLHALALRLIDWSHAMHDVRYALRLLLRQPAFAAAAIATLSLGVGGATAVFSVADAVLLRPLTYSDSERLVWMFGAFKQNDSAAVSPPDFVDYRDRNAVFDSLGAMAIAPGDVTVPAPDGPVRMQASQVSAGLLDTLGARLVAGRDFAREEESAGRRTLIVSNRIAVERFGSAAAALGQVLNVDDAPRVIVGVVESSFVLPYDSFIRLDAPVDLFVPLPLDLPETHIRRFHWLRLIGRLKPGVTLDSAQVNMDVIARQLEAAYPENETWRLRLLPLHERMVADARPVLQTIMAAVTVVLLMACVNVAGLMLARANARSAEMAIRSALGASRRRVLRQLLVEGLVLSVAGAGAGALVAWVVIEVLKSVGPATLPRLQEIALDPRAIGFAFAAGIGTTLLFALLPAIAASRRDLASPARSGSRASGAGAARLRPVLVSGQIAMSVLLLVSAGLLTRSFVRLVSVDPGFATDDVLLAKVVLPDRRYASSERTDAYFVALLDRLSTVPGVQAIAASSAPPLAGANDTAVHLEGDAPASPAGRRFAQIRWIQGSYFHLFGIPIVAGRSLDDGTDRPGTPPAVVISRNMAERSFAGTDPIGRKLVIDLGTPTTAEIVGIAADARLFGQGAAAPHTMYLSSRQAPRNYLQIVARTSLDAGQFSRAFRSAVNALDPTLAPAQVETMRSLVDRSVAQPRFRMLLIGAFAGVALMLTLVGLYGTVSYAVSQRRREIGIRLAVGADGPQVIGLVVRQTSWMLLVGLPLGVGAAWMAGRAISTQLFEVEPTDPLVFIAVPLAVAAIAIAAILGPARAAARVDPVIALRTE
jgi:putative ABC transport system permease protein